MIRITKLARCLGFWVHQRTNPYKHFAVSNPKRAALFLDTCILQMSGGPDNIWASLWATKIVIRVSESVYFVDKIFSAESKFPNANVACQAAPRMDNSYSRGSSGTSHRCDCRKGRFCEMCRKSIPTRRAAIPPKLMVAVDRNALQTNLTKGFIAGRVVRR